MKFKADKQQSLAESASDFILVCCRHFFKGHPPRLGSRASTWLLQENDGEYYTRTNQRRESTWQQQREQKSPPVRSGASVPLSPVAKRTRYSKKKREAENTKVPKPPVKQKKPYRELADKTRRLAEFHKYVCNLEPNLDDAIALVRDWLTKHEKKLTASEEYVRHACKSFRDAVPGMSAIHRTVACVDLLESMETRPSLGKLESIAEVSEATARRAIQHRQSLLAAPLVTVQEPAHQLVVEHPALSNKRKSRLKTIPTALDSARQQFLANWLRDNAPTKSGSLNAQCLRYPTFFAAYHIYCAHAVTSNMEPYGNVHFTRLLRTWGVKPLAYDEYACPKCYSLDCGDRSESLVVHEKAVKIGVERYRNSTDNVSDTATPGNIIVMLVDYARIHELGIGKGDAKKLSVLNITIVLTKNSQRCFDYFSCAKQGYAFMKEAFQRFANEFETLGVTSNASIHYWSDGGLRNYGTVSALHYLSKRLRHNIIAQFFPSYHGHSRCDAHFGLGKRTLRKTFPVGGLEFSDQVVSIFNSLVNSEAVKMAPKDLDEHWKSEDQWNLGKEENPSSWLHKGHGIKSWNMLTFANGLIAASAWSLEGGNLASSRQLYMDVPTKKKPDSDENLPSSTTTSSTTQPVPKQHVIHQASLVSASAPISSTETDIYNIDHSQLLGLLSVPTVVSTETTEKSRSVPAERC